MNYNRIYLSFYFIIYFSFILKLVKGHFESEITPSEIDFAPFTPISFQL
jgi:hypothetical protein